VLALERPVAGRAGHVADDRFLARDLGFPLLDAGIDEVDAPLGDGVDGLEHAGVVVHRFVHRGRDDDWCVGTERGRGTGRDGRVVDGTRDLADGVRRRGCDQEYVGPALIAAEIDVFDAARDLRDDLVFGGKLDRQGWMIPCALPVITPREPPLRGVAARGPVRPSSRPRSTP